MEVNKCQLDNVKSISKYAFENHNEDLTIYCYEGSAAAKYAIDNNIKYVYLKRVSVKELTATVTYNPTTSTTKKDSTVTSEKKLPQTGENLTVVALIGCALITTAVVYIGLNKYKGIK